MYLYWLSQWTRHIMQVFTLSQFLSLSLFVCIAYANNCLKTTFIYYFQLERTIVRHRVEYSAIYITGIPSGPGYLAQSRGRKSKLRVIYWNQTRAQKQIVEKEEINLFLLLYNQYHIQLYLRIYLQCNKPTNKCSTTMRCNNHSSKDNKTHGTKS